MNGRNENAYTILVKKPWVKDEVVDTGVCGKIILRCISNMVSFYLTQNVIQCLTVVNAAVNLAVL